MKTIDHEFNAIMEQQFMAADPLIVGEGEDNQDQVYGLLLSMLMLMLIFFIGEGVIEKYHPRIGH